MIDIRRNAPTAKPRTWLRGMLFAAVSAAVVGCSSDPVAGTLPSNVGASFAPCNEAEIRYLSTKHNFMPAFRPCGANNFNEFQWSPTGRHLYFQLVMTPHIMDASVETKPTIAVPVPSPIGPAAWMSQTRISIPVGPAEGEAEDNSRVAVYDIEQKSVFFRDAAGFTDLDDLQRGADPGELFFVGEKAGKRGVYRMDLADGSITQPWPFVPDNVDSFTYTPAQKTAIVSADGTVRIFDVSSGEQTHSFERAMRATLHPEGRWLALEHLGDPVSVFYQRSWDELSEEARKREQRRVEQWESQLPETFEKEVQPPTLSFIDLKDPKQKRWMVSSVYGWDFQWYEATPYYGSFVLWGFEGKQVKRNVMLGQWNDYLRAAELRRKRTGLEPFPGVDPEYVERKPRARPDEQAP